MVAASWVFQNPGVRFAVVALQVPTSVAFPVSITGPQGDGAVQVEDVVIDIPPVVVPGSVSTTVLLANGGVLLTAVAAIGTETGTTSDMVPGLTPVTVAVSGADQSLEIVQVIAQLPEAVHTAFPIIVLSCANDGVVPISTNPTAAQSETIASPTRLRTR